jgi:hypothetical protein
LAKKIILSGDPIRPTSIQDFLVDNGIYNKIPNNSLTISKIESILKNLNNKIQSDELNNTEVAKILFDNVVNNQKKDINSLLTYLKPGEQLDSNAKSNIDNILNTRIKQSALGIDPNITTIQETSVTNNNWYKDILPYLTNISSYLDSSSKNSRQNFDMAQNAFQNAFNIMESEDAEKAKKFSSEKSIKAGDIDKANTTYIENYMKIFNIYNKANQDIFKDENNNIYSEIVVGIEKTGKKEDVSLDEITNGTITKENSEMSDEIWNILENFINFTNEIKNNRELLKYIADWYIFYYDKSMNKDINAESIDKILEENKFFEVWVLLLQTLYPYFNDENEQKVRQSLYNIKTYARYAIYNDVNGKPIEQTDRIENITPDPFKDNILRSGQSVLSVCIGSFMEIRNQWNQQERRAKEIRLTEICREVYGQNPNFLWNLFKATFNRTNRMGMFRSIRNRIGKMLLHNRFVNELQKMVALPKSW